MGPAPVDPNSSYHYYSLELMPEVHGTTALEDLDLAPDHIAETLKDVPSEHRVQYLLRSNLEEIDADMQEILRRTSLIDFRIRMLEAETSFSNLDVVGSDYHRFSRQKFSYVLRTANRMSILRAWANEL